MMLEFPEDGPRVVQGVDSVEQIGKLTHDLDARRALLVTDRHIVNAGHVDRAVASLEAAHIAVAVFDEVHENPTTEDVDACLKLAQSAEVDVIIGFGGGSSLDTAKGCNFILTNGGKMADYRGTGKAKHAMLPLIAVPTTAGTGSECQSYALIADALTHEKMACGDPKALPAVSILDPTLTVTQPRNVTANTAVDAMTHAVETAVTTRRTDTSLQYAREAFRLIHENMPTVFTDPDDLDARAAMQLAAAYAGTAIEHSMLGAAHAAANPLTATFGIIHGQAVGLMITPVIEHNLKDSDAADLYEQLANHAGLNSVNGLLNRIDELLTIASIPRRLFEHQVDEDTIPTLAEQAADQWTAQFNPRPVTADDFTMLYKSVL